MAKKANVTLFVLGLLLISLVVLAIYQSALVGGPDANLSDGASRYEALSCPTRWDDEADLYIIETGVEIEEPSAWDQAPWASEEAHYLRL